MPWIHAHGGRAAACGALLALCACSPSLDWREVRPEDSGAVALFPCKPSTDARMVTLAGTRVRMVLAACKAADTTWALAYADVADPVRVTPALEALRTASRANLGGTVQVLGPMKVEGMTPNPQAERVRVQGRLPGGNAVTLEGGFFVRGTRVYQSTAMGRAPDAEAVATFFDNLKLPS
ncbi:MAG: hypothetical protein KF891_24040 [Rhizobacter sp.]|nr:hypothetical protein [Rhizobacter sp.]